MPPPQEYSITDKKALEWGVGAESARRYQLFGEDDCSEGLCVSGHSPVLRVGQETAQGLLALKMTALQSRLKGSLASL